MRFALALLLGLCGLPGLVAAPIQLEVDASEATRRVFHSRLVIPAAPGPLTLVYPKWFPGTHAPTGPIADLVGLRMAAGGRDLAWTRDPLDVYAFHCRVPEGADRLEVGLDFVVPTDRQTAHHPSAASEHAAMISWTSLLLYPSGQPATALTYEAVLRLPDGWQYGTSLATASRDGAQVRFAPVSLYTLIDSPVVAGAHFKTLDLRPGSDVPFQMHLAADSEGALQVKPEALAAYRRLVAEALALFGARHFRRYDFLLTLSDPLEGGAVEHHESSDNRPPERMFLDADVYRVWADTLPHEMVHSWVGKWRRPAGMDTPDYQAPIHSELLWVYEGLTNYLGNVLAARAGLLSAEEFRDAVAWMAASQDRRPGRSWRPLADTTAGVASVIDASSEWQTWRRSRDYYNEGVLIWLEVDTLLRQKSGGRVSLDDLCRGFFGGQDGPPEVKPFTLEELAGALNALVPYDWQLHFASRLDAKGDRAPLEGIEQSGFRLEYAAPVTPYFKSAEKTEKEIDLRYSIGLLLSEEGRVKDVVPGSAAARAGVAPGSRLLGVGGRRFSRTRIEEAVTASKDGRGALELLVENGDFYRVVGLDYHEGSKYPRLQRVEGHEDLLSRIAAPRTTEAAGPS